MDEQSRHGLHHAARTAAVFGEFSDLSDITAVSDFEVVPRDDEALALGVVGVQGRTIPSESVGGVAVSSARRSGGDDEVIRGQGVVGGGQEDCLLGFNVSRRNGDSTRGSTIGGNRLDSVIFGRGTAIVQFELLDATFSVLNDGVRIDTSMEELRRNQGQLTEVALEVVDGGRDAVGGGVTGGANTSAGRRASRGTGRVDQFRELTLEFRANNGFVVLELTSLFVDRGHDVLNSVFTEVGDVRASANDRGIRGDEVSVNVPDGLALRAVLVGIGGGGGLVLLQPSREASGAVGGSTIINGGHNVRGEGKFHRTLHVDGGLSQLTAQFVLNTSDVENVLSEVGNVNSPAEQVDVVFNFSTEAERVLLEVSVGARVGRVNVLAVKDAEFDRGVGIAVNLPAEGRISWLRATLGHGRDRGFLRIHVGDEVREFFSDTHSCTLKGTSILELVLE